MSVVCSQRLWVHHHHLWRRVAWPHSPRNLLCFAASGHFLLRFEMRNWWITFCVILTRSLNECESFRGGGWGVTLRGHNVRGSSSPKAAANNQQDSCRSTFCVALLTLAGLSGCRLNFRRLKSRDLWDLYQPISSLHMKMTEFNGVLCSEVLPIRFSQIGRWFRFLSLCCWMWMKIVCRAWLCFNHPYFARLPKYLVGFLVSGCFYWVHNGGKPSAILTFMD